MDESSTNNGLDTENQGVSTSSSTTEPSESASSSEESEESTPESTSGAETTTETGSAVEPATTIDLGDGETSSTVSTLVTESGITTDTTPSSTPASETCFMNGVTYLDQDDVPSPDPCQFSCHCVDTTA